MGASGSLSDIVRWRESSRAELFAIPEQMPFLEGVSGLVKTYRKVAGQPPDFQILKAPVGAMHPG